jgi:hypothetical protein
MSPESSWRVGPVSDRIGITRPSLVQLLGNCLVKAKRHSPNKPRIVVTGVWSKKYYSASWLQDTMNLFEDFSWVIQVFKDPEQSDYIKEVIGIGELFCHGHGHVP